MFEPKLTICLSFTSEHQSNTRTPSEPMSTSKLARIMGNKLLNSVREQQFGMIESYKLSGALGCYKKAISLATNDVEEVLALESAARASRKLALLRTERSEPEEVSGVDRSSRFYESNDATSV